EAFAAATDGQAIGVEHDLALARLAHATDDLRAATFDRFAFEIVGRLIEEEIATAAQLLGLGAELRFAERDVDDLTIAIETAGEVVHRLALLADAMHRGPRRALVAPELAAQRAERERALAAQHDHGLVNRNCVWLPRAGEQLELTAAGPVVRGPAA